MRPLFMTTVLSIRERYVPCVAQMLHQIFETAKLKRGTVVASFQKTLACPHVACPSQFRNIV